MKKILTILFLLSVTLPGFACRFTVREIGFADFGKDQYRFVLFKDENTPDAFVKSFKSIASAAMFDANVIVQVIDVKTDTSALSEYYKDYSGAVKPDLMLISPEKRAKAFFIDKSQNFTSALWDIMEDILVSPARTELAEHIIRSYCVVYFIEGTDLHENERARAVLNTGVEEIKNIMGGLPHPVNTPPYIVTVKAGDLEKEKVLLWSLGWEEKDSAHPAVAMMYGRARRMGPILKNDRIRQDIIENMLRFIGEDCECGLDRSWMLGTMLPLRWDNDLRKQVLKVHGFDADNPMVISEMSQILSIAPNRVNKSVSTDLLYGYAENVAVVKKAEQNRQEEIKDKTEDKRAENPDRGKNENQNKKVAGGVITEKGNNIGDENKLNNKDTVVSENNETLPEINLTPLGKIKPVKIDEPPKTDDGFSIRDAIMYSIAGLLLILITGLILFFRSKRK